MGKIQFEILKKEKKTSTYGLDTGWIRRKIWVRYGEYVSGSYLWVSNMYPEVSIAYPDGYVLRTFGYGIPLFGEFTCQNAVMAERFIEAGSAYVLKLEKADVYRLPYLASSGPGFALLEAARKANFKDILSRIARGFSSNSWYKPVLLAWGISDKYLRLSEAEEFQKANPSVITLKPIEGAGHMPQEDWPEKVVEALKFFLL